MDLIFEVTGSYPVFGNGGGFNSTQNVTASLTAHFRSQPRTTLEGLYSTLRLCVVIYPSEWIFGFEINFQFSASDISFHQLSK